MKVLLVYGTTEGQTEKVVKFMAQRLTRQGHLALSMRAGVAQPPRDVAEFDVVVVAASVRAGRYQPGVVHYVRQHLAAIGTKPNAFVSVSLAAASHDPDDLAGLKKCVAGFCHATGWTPGQIHHVAGAFRYTQYGFVTRWMMKRIATRKGVSTDTSRDLELTDWDEVARVADALTAPREAAVA